MILSNAGSWAASWHEGRWFRTVVRGRYHLTRHWDGLLEYRWLDVDEADDNRQGPCCGLTAISMII